MATGGSSSEQARTNAGASKASSAPAQRMTLNKVSSLAESGLGAAATVSGRMLGFGALGVLLGAVAFFIERATGLLAHPWEPWGYLVYALLLAYVVAGAVMLGLAGMWRGIGRVAMDLVKKHGLVRHIVDRIFERAAILSAGTATPEVLRRPLPVQMVREKLSQASAAYSRSEDLEKGTKGLTRAILRRIKRWLCGELEVRFVALVGEQARDTGAVELTLTRLHELASEEAEGRVDDMLEGLRNKQALIWGLLFAGVLALPPIVLALLRR